MDWRRRRDRVKAEKSRHRATNSDRTVGSSGLKLFSSMPNPRHHSRCIEERLSSAVHFMSPQEFPCKCCCFVHIVFQCEEEKKAQPICRTCFRFRTTIWQPNSVIRNLFILHALFPRTSSSDTQTRLTLFYERSLLREESQHPLDQRRQPT